MSTIKRATRQVKGKTKEAIAEVLGDGKLQQEAKDEQRQDQQDEDKELGGPKPLGNLDRLT